jgi:hypothetical protein
MNILIDRCEEALAAVLNAAGAGALAQVATGKSPDTKSIPIIICECDGGDIEEDPKATGNFWVNATVTIKTRAVENETATGSDATPKVTSQNLVDLVMNALIVDDLPAQLSAAVATFTVFPNGVIYQSPASGKDLEGIWHDILPLRIYCCPSTVAP